MRVKKFFIPLDDISTVELAVIVANGGGGPYGVFFEEDRWEKLPNGIKRHFGDRRKSLLGDDLLMSGPMEWQQVPRFNSEEGSS